MFTTIFKATAAACVGLGALTTLASGADVTIDAIAPSNSVIIVQVKETAELMERCKANGFGALAELEQLDSVRELLADRVDAGMMLLGDDEDGNPFPKPTGALGMTLYPVTDPETGAIEMGFYAFADFGDQADAAMERFAEMLEKGEDEGVIETEAVEIGDEEGTHIQSVSNADLDDDPWAEEDPLESLVAGDGYLLRAGNIIMLGSSTDLIERTIDLMAGTDSGDGTIADDDTYRGIVAQLGASDASVIVPFGNLATLLAPLDPSMGMMTMMLPTLEVAVGSVAGMGYALDLEDQSGDRMATIVGAVYMPDGKTGISEMVSATGPRTALPAFAGPDTVSYTQASFTFSEVLGLIDRIINSNAFLQMQAADAIEQFKPTLEQVFSSLGTTVVATGSLTHPIELSSMKNFYAIECTNAQRLQDGLGSFAPMIGLESRDFLGHTVFTMDVEGGGMSMPMMGGGGGDTSFSLGIGGGWLFMGDTPAVEASLRTVGRDADEDAGGPAYARADAVLGSAPVSAWGYVDLVEMLEANAKIAKLQFDQTIEEMREFDPDYARELEEGDMGREMEVTQDVIRILSEHVGPLAWEMTSTDEGFVGHYILLKKE